MELNEDVQQRIEELKAIEQQVQIFLAQRQAAQLELNEIQNAFDEVKKSGGEMYKIVGGVMIKSEKETILKELEEKKKVIEMRIQSTEKQEKLVEKRAIELRRAINEAVAKGPSRTEKRK